MRKKNKALLGLIFPGATLAIMIGSFVGGLVVSSGYTAGKTYVLALIENNDVNLLVPVEETAVAIKKLKTSAEIKLKDALASLKEFGKKTKGNVTIKVYNLASAL